MKRGVSLREQLMQIYPLLARQKHSDPSVGAGSPEPNQPSREDPRSGTPGTRNKALAARPPAIPAAVKKKKRRVRRPQPKALKPVPSTPPIDTSIYRKPVHPESKARHEPKNLEQVLPDMGQFCVRAAKGWTRTSILSNPLTGEGNSIVTIGLDFGTAYTKAVIRQGARHFLVDWSDAVEIDCNYLMPSVFSEAPDGTLRLGTTRKKGWRIHDGLKMHLLAHADNASLAEAAAFVAEPPRHSRRLQPLRGLEHEHREAVLT